MTLITLPAFLVPYAFYLNVMVALIALTFYALSVRLIGTRWARWQWDAWKDAMSSQPEEGLLRWWFLFPGMTFHGKIGESIPTRFSWTPRHWFAPMIAIAVTRCQNVRQLTEWQYEHRWQSKRFVLQMQALFWAPSLAWNLATLFVIVVGTILWAIVWYLVLGIPRMGLRSVTKTHDGHIAAAPVVAAFRTNP